jgi:hypothetical protein
VKTAVDTSVLLDVFTGDPVFGEASRQALRRAHDAGKIVACEVVWAEVAAQFPSREAFSEAMDAVGIDFEPLGAASAAWAGELWRRHHAGRTRAGRSPRQEAKRVVADFLIGAHAQRQCDALLSRDRGFYRSVFKGLKLVQP